MDSSSCNQVVLAYDLETLRKAIDWSEADKREMGVACCGLSSLDGETWIASAQSEALYGVGDHQIEIAELQFHFDRADVLVSFSGGDESEPGFDNVVLAGAGITVEPAKCFDVRLRLKAANGGTLPKGCSLDALAKANLGYGKTGHGGDAPADWAAGKYREVAKYCLYGDVALTKGLYRLWMQQGFLLLPDGSTKVFAPTQAPAKGQERSSARIENKTPRAKFTPPPERSGSGSEKSPKKGSSECSGSENIVEKNSFSELAKHPLELLPRDDYLQWEKNARGGIEAWHTPSERAPRRDRTYLGYLGKRELTKLAKQPRDEAYAGIRNWIAEKRRQKGIAE